MPDLREICDALIVESLFVVIPELEGELISGIASGSKVFRNGKGIDVRHFISAGLRVHLQLRDRHEVVRDLERFELVLCAQVIDLINEVEGFLHRLEAGCIIRSPRMGIGSKGLPLVLLIGAENFQGFLRVSSFVEPESAPIQLLFRGSLGFFNAGAGGIHFLLGFLGRFGIRRDGLIVSGLRGIASGLSRLRILF